MMELSPDQQKILDDAIAKRDEFLEKHPHLKEVQKEYDRIIDAVPEEKRLEVATIMLSSSLVSLSQHQADLANLLKQSIDPTAD